MLKKEIVPWRSNRLPANYVCFTSLVQLFLLVCPEPIHGQADSAGFRDALRLSTQVNAERSSQAKAWMQVVSSGDWQQAAQQLVRLRDRSSNQLVQADDQAGSLSGRFVAERILFDQLADQQLANYAELRRVWNGQIREKVRLRLETGFANIAEAKAFFNRYRQSEFASAIAIRYARQLVAAERLNAAANLLCQLDNRFSRFQKFAVPVESPSIDPGALNQQQLAEVAARLVLLRWLTDLRLGQQGTRQVDSDLDWFQKSFGDQKGHLGNRQGNLLDLLKQYLPRPDSNQVAGTANESSTFSPAWEIRFPVAGKVPTIAASTDIVIWRNEESLFAANIESGQPAFDNGTKATGDSLAHYVIWRNAEPVGTSGSAADGVNQIFENPTDFSSIEVANNQVFTLCGDGETAFIIGLDLGQQGRMLSGFPLLPPTRQYQFVGTPLVRRNRLYIPALLQSSDSKNETSCLVCYDLRQNESASPLQPTWIQRFGTANRQSDENYQQLANRIALTLNDGSIYFCDNRGLIVSVDAEDGATNWLAQYQRTDYATAGPFVSRLSTQRIYAAPVVIGQSVYALPFDSPYCFALNRKSGQCRWRKNLPAANQIVDFGPGELGRTDRIWLAGSQLLQLDYRAGAILRKYPEGYVNTLPGLSSEFRSNPINAAAVTTGRLASSILVAMGNRLLAVPAVAAADHEPVTRTIISELPGRAHVIYENGRILVATGGMVRAISLSVSGQDTVSEKREGSD